MSTESVLCSVEAGHARVTLNRPEFHNPLSDGVMSRLAAVFADLRADPTVRVVTIRGAGPSFCAGADLKMFLRVLDDPAALTAFIRSTKTVFTAIERFPHPVIAVVHGFVLAGGLELMLACDLAIAAEDAVLGDQHINFGLIPGGGATQRLPRILGQRKAKELMFLGSRVSGVEAERLGLVNRAVPGDRLEAAAEEWVRTLREKSPTALSYMKELVQGADNVPLETGLDLEAGLFLTYARLGDLHEGLRAFQEKRPPRY
jgi:enoyl-CoA hydratase/carnithine racemase